MEPNFYSDNQLMMQVKGGELTHLGLLFERYHKILFGFFYRMNQNVAVSEDLVQNVFVRILRYKHRFQNSGEFKAWMFQIARNVHADHYRNRRNATKESIDDWQDKLLDSTPNQYTKLMKQEELKQLEAALQKLDPEKREILILSKFKGLKYKQIAQLLDCTEGAVKVKVFRALKALKTLMNPTKP